MEEKLIELAKKLEGELYWDDKIKILYATDASAYREIPLAVAYPKTEADIQCLIQFAKNANTSLIPRTAGTSLAGQVVGAGVVVDVSKYFTAILEIDEAASWVRVQPGVIRDELNMALKPYQLYFGPETSTANRAMIGGMVGNNSCGSNSLIYGSTREHIIEIKGFLSDGSEVVFNALTFDEFVAKSELNTLEGRIYHQIKTLLSNYENQLEIRREFPKKSIPRRNTGYAIDLLLDTDPFTAGEVPFNFCTLIAGSEGTLAFITEIKLHVVPLPTKPRALLGIHFLSLEEALNANLIALKYKPLSCELIDHYILECTKNNLEQQQNRFFIEGEPKAILLVELDGNDEHAILQKVHAIEEELRTIGLGYYFPIIFGQDMQRVWALRKAGLGLLSNLPGDEKAVAVIEDTAVDVQDLPAYIQEFNDILAKYGLYAVHYAHAATGELHLRPILNLKTVEGTALFRTVAKDIARLVKKYRGSLSGEHGDGRLRGEFISYMIGGHNYALLKQIKDLWDPHHIFNPNKIVDTPAMNSMLRYDPSHKVKKVQSVFRYPGQDILQHVEQCNGSGDCRKTHLGGGTMCPSYMVTRSEQDTTRARANMLREMLTYSDQENPYDYEELKEIMDLCLSCKGCKNECPSSVDMAKLKADFMQGYHDANRIPLRTRMIAHIDQVSRIGAVLPALYNWSVSNPVMSQLIKRGMGIASLRSLPTIGRQSLRRWFLSREKPNASLLNRGTIYFFCDEFTNYNDVEIGKKAILLLEGLRYQVLLVRHVQSGRALLSKGFLRKAKRIAEEQVQTFKNRISAETPLLGLEPSAILTFRDEYVDLVDESMVEDARHIAKHALLIDEFLANEMENGKIEKEEFSTAEMSIKLHGHCQQKAWKVVNASERILSFPEHYKVDSIPSGCCGMAGSFGYEKEHYDMSMQIGALVLFPAVQATSAEELIAATGTSCRHQIYDGTKKRALHPVEILYDALLNK
ncbi:FAD-binding and (Fe-S)-binding domain-containing protein [Sphingobacterium sp. SYP-B4668]|uniref:FAD-binding and (Fe-S)-binding domain-containing protein n=1 Tax=Sphingobacterium sp. SYP-B4668 TaxID=2996035 RepID=UPI0022DE7D5E|nr:FAD-binding and (Fe-S)-binding domain-containing protein [Sphingobacterium sp. SYP-B4668]